MNLNKNNYIILFVTGSAGNFINRIIEYYVNDKKIDNLPLLETGEAITIDTDNTFVNTTTIHNKSSDLINSKPKVILISYDDNDIDLISRMFWFKKINDTHAHSTYEVLKGPDWPDFQTYCKLPNKYESVTKEIVEHNREHRIQWLRNIDRSQVDYEISFKTIMGFDNNNLNQEIANIIEIPVNPKVQDYIDQYRQVNYRLYLK